MKVEYLRPDDTTSKAYLDEPEIGPGTYTGTDKYTDEPVTVWWNDHDQRWEQQP